MNTEPLRAPYPSDTRAKGWRFELDYERIDQSDTWALAKGAARGWLLLQWLLAWRQVPCGSLPADEEVIAAKLDMPPKEWAKHRKVLMRGWERADDGRLYHPTVTARVLEMLEYRRKNAERVAKFKAALREQREGNALPERESPAKNDTGTGTGTGTGTSPPSSERNSEPDGSAHADRSAFTPPNADSPPTLTRAALWAAGKSLLAEQGMPAGRCGAFVAKLVKDHGEEALIDALGAAVVERPADAASWLVAAAKRRAGSRPRAVVPQSRAERDAEARRLLGFDRPAEASNA